MQKNTKTGSARPSSAREKSRFWLKMLCACAIMTALSVVLDGYLSIPVGGGIKFTFGFVPPAVIGMLYGPLPSAIVFGLADLTAVAVGITVGTYHPGFTVCNLLMGLCFGLCLHPNPFYSSKKPPCTLLSLPRRIAGVAISTLFNNIVCGLLLNTLWVSMLYGSRTYYGWFLYRLPQYAVMIPLYIVLLLVLSRLAPLFFKMGFGKR